MTARDYFLITAGHCGGDATRPWSQTGDNPFNGAVPIGAPDRNTYTGTTAADAQRIPIRAEQAAHLIRVSTSHSYVVSTQQRVDADVEKERTCMSGATSAEMERCGVLVSRNANGAVGDGRTLIRHREATWYSLQGDSGGSVMDRSQAKGVVFGNVAYNPNKTSEYQNGIYSHIGEVLPALGITRVN